MMKKITRFVYTDLLAPNSLSVVMRMSSFLLVQGEYLSHGSLFSAFRKKKESQSVLVPAVSQVPLI